MTDEPICEAMNEIAKYHMARGLPPLGELEQPYDYGRIGPWRVVINGTGQALTWQSDDEMAGEIPPWSAWVNYNGWLAGLFSPFGGEFMAGAGANEDTFIAALRGAVEE